MKKLKRLTLKSIEESFEVLTPEEQRRVIGGDGNEPSWDCMFNCFIQYYRDQTGITLDKNDLVQQYSSIYGNPSEMGGARVGDFFSFIYSRYGISASQLEGGIPSFTGSQLAAFSLDNSGILHFAIPKLVKVESDGVWVYCDDPTTGKVERYSYSEWRALYQLNGDYIDSPIDLGSWGSLMSSWSMSTGSIYYA